MTIFTGGLRKSSGIGISDLGASTGEYLGAKAGEAVDSMPVVSLAHIGELSAAQGQAPDFGGMVLPELTDLFTNQPDTPIGEARQRVKEAGLEQMLHLPDAPTIKTPALEIMLDRARAKREREATISRGPDSYAVGALGVGTSFLVGALDPLNVASAFIPVIGEARYAKLLADAGTSAVGRFSRRAAVGAASGALGQGMVEPLEAIARTQEGQDYTMADALRSVMFGTVLGGGLHAGGGAIADVYRGRKGTPLYPFAKGEPLHDPEADLFKVSPSSRGAGDVGQPAAPAAERISDTFINPPAAEIPQERHASLLEFLASRGGIRNDDPLIGDVRSAVGGANHFVGGHGNLIRKPGEVSSAGGRGGAHEPMTLDQAREAAVEAGYLVDHGKEAGAVGTTTVRTLLDAMDGELRGQKVYPVGTKPKVDAGELERANDELTFRLEQAHADLDRALQEEGHIPAADLKSPANKQLRERAAELMVKEGVHDPLEAYHQAVMERPEPSPVVAALDDLPPRAKEDLLRGAIGALHDGMPVSAWEQLVAGAQTDPRISASLDVARQPVSLSAASRDLPELPQGATAAGHGPNGPVIVGLQNRWSDAVAWLRSAETGDAVGVLQHPQVPGGRIDVIWGEGGDRGYGLAHIIDQGHTEVLPDLPERFARMHLVRIEQRGGHGTERLVLQSADGAETAIVRSSFDGEAKTWLLTAYTPESDHRGGGSRRGGGTPGSPTAEPGPARSPGPPAEGTIAGVAADVDSGQPTAMWVNKDFDVPVKILDEPAQRGDDGRFYQRVEFDGRGSFVPLDELRQSDGTPVGARTADAEWKALAGRPRDFDEPAARQASQDALNATEPASLSEKPNERIQAAEAAAAEAEAEYRAAEPYLPDDLKAAVEHKLAQLDADLADRTEVIRRGAACLASIAGGV